MSKPFNRFMVANDNGRNLKLSRFTDAEFRAFIQGVLPIASQATPRGAFMVGGQPATAEDVVFMAPKVSKRAAESTLQKMRELGMLEADDELGGEWVHDFDKLNPAPKTDRTNAKRQAAFRARNAESNGSRNAESNGVTNADVTPPEVKKVEVEDPPTPLTGDPAPKRLMFNRKPVPTNVHADALRVHDHFNATFGTGYKPLTKSGKASNGLSRILGAMLEQDMTADQAIGAVDAAQADPWWPTGQTPHPGMVFGPNVIERYLQAAVSSSQAPDNFAALVNRMNGVSS